MNDKNDEFMPEDPIQSELTQVVVTPGKDIGKLRPTALSTNGNLGAEYGSLTDKEDDD
jgi:hypothetical protein